jgi:hypothetical protein
MDGALEEGGVRFGRGPRFLFSRNRGLSRGSVDEITPARVTTRGGDVPRTGAALGRLGGEGLAERG